MSSPLDKAYPPSTISIVVLRHFAIPSRPLKYCGFGADLYNYTVVKQREATITERAKQGKAK